MDMKSYLDEVAHAAESVISLVWAEHSRVSQATAEVNRLTLVTQHAYDRAAAWRESEDLDDFMAGVGQQWETYFGPDKERHHAAEAEAGAQSILVARTFSRAAMAASVIQYAKQGVSVVHGKREPTPFGRLVLGERLSALIWNARNQVLHWEDGQFTARVTELFERLSGTDPRFSDYRTRNTAFDVVDGLGWRTYDAFQADMMSLA